MVADKFNPAVAQSPSFGQRRRRILAIVKAGAVAVGGRVLLVCFGLALALPGVCQTVAPTPNAAPLLRDDLPDVQKRSRSVAILPILVDLPAVEDLFGADRQKAAPAVPDIASNILRMTTGQPYVSVLSAARVRDALAGDADGQLRARNAEEWYRKGLQLYLGLGPQAHVYLRQAVSEYAAAFQDLIDAKPFADALFMLGVSLIDSGDKDAGHIALKEAFRLEPMRRFRANFFPPVVNAALLAALYDRQKTADPIHPYGDNRRMLQLAQRLGVQWLIFGSLRPGSQPNAASELWLAIYDAQRRVVDAEIRLPAENSTDRLDAFLTRWLACAQVSELAPVSLAAATTFASTRRPRTRFTTAIRPVKPFTVLDSQSVSPKNFAATSNGFLASTCTQAFPTRTAIYFILSIPCAPWSAWALLFARSPCAFCPSGHRRPPARQFH